MAKKYNFDDDELKGREPKYNMGIVTPDVGPIKGFGISPLLAAHSLFTKYGSAFIYKAFPTVDITKDKEPDDRRESPFYPIPINDNELIFQWADEQLIVKLAFIGLGRTKNISRTDINGRSGSIKEYYSSGDYEMNITGTLFNDTPDLIPEKQIIALSELYEWNKTVEVFNLYLSRLGVTKMVIENIQLNQSQIANEQEFTIFGFSDFIKNPR